MKPIRIFLADDHPGFVAGIRAELEQELDMEVVGVAHSGADVLDGISTTRPDVLLLDMELPDKSGVEIARHLQRSGSSVLVLPISGFSDPEYVFGVLELGAAGYMTKDESLKDIVEAVRKVAQGGAYVSSLVALNVVGTQKKRRKKASERSARLQELDALGISATLLETLKLVAQGYNNRQIGEMRFRSEHTIRNHVDKLRTLIGVSWRPELVAWVWRQGVMDLEVEDANPAAAIPRDPDEA